MGDTLGKFEILKKIAQGGIADLFLSRRSDEDDGAFYAVKRMLPQLSGAQEAVSILLEEGRVAATLDHPNIVKIYDVGTDGDVLYIAMEYVHGRDLRSTLERGFAAENPIPIELAASIAAQASAALHHAHTQVDEAGAPLNLMHTDVSPQNILIGLDGTVKLCDFGIAKAEHRISHTSDGQVKGKFSYMAPEQIEGGEVDARSDLFALGIVLYETTTMTRLFKADNQYMALEKILYAGIETPTSLRPGYPADLERIVMKALERDPAARYQTAEELQLALEEWLVQNKASASAVALARYMRGLFPELPRTVVLDEPAARSGEHLAKRDVTEMNEDDLDAALDVALGAPSEADLVSRSAPVEDSPVPQPPLEPEGIFKADYSDDATMIREIPEELREKDAREARQHAEAPEEPAPEEPAQPVLPSVIVPTVTKEPEVSSLAAKSEPTVAPEPVVPVPAAVEPELPLPGSAPAVPEPKPTVEAQVPVNLLGTGPKTVAPPPRGPKSAPPRAQTTAPRPAVTSADSADVSIDDIGDIKMSNNKTGILVGAALVVGLIVIAVVALNQGGTGAVVKEELEKKTIDPADLVVEPAPKAERVAVQIDLTPADASVVVNGLPVEVSGGKIPLFAGTSNEVAVFAPGHAPERLVVEGSAGAPIRVELTAGTPPAGEVASLDIVSEPRDATVWVDGVQVGKTPTSVADLWTGAEHHVYIELDGYLPYAGIIGLGQGEQRPVDVRLEKTDSARQGYVELLVNAIPRGTSVQIEGESEPLGLSPLFKNLDRNRVLTLGLREADSAPMRRHVALEEVGTFELRPFLASMKRERGTIVVSVEPPGPSLYVGPNGYGKGPTKALEFTEGKVNVVLDTGNGRLETTLDVVPNTETQYVLRYSGGNIRAEKK